jgi:vancomycin resistance protein VanW
MTGLMVQADESVTRVNRGARASLRGAVIAAGVLACAALVIALLRLPQLPSEEKVIAAFSTSLRGRAHSQVHNVRLALAALDGAVIRPGAEFSFNRTVGPWTVDRGYRRAPVSFSGEMVLDWGGGVCQASTTLYNAALLAGLPILERHRHHWPASYVPPGQDAAVAYPGVDLRFRNSLASPIRVSARIVGESVRVRLCSRARPPAVQIARDVLAVEPAMVTRLISDGTRRGPARGKPGCEVAVYRIFLGGNSRRELVSRDTYPPLNRVVSR